MFGNKKSNLASSWGGKIFLKAKGVSIENFKKNQEEIFGRYDSGFFGYRGLQGKNFL